MSTLIASELLKLRTARTFIILISLGVGLGILIATATAAFSDFSPGDEPAVDLVSTAWTVVLFTWMLGVISITTEYRHGSIASALLVEPDRIRLLVAKLIACAMVGAAICLLTAGLQLLIGQAILPGRGYELGLDGGEVLELLAGSTAAGALLGALGVGLGAAVRKQTPAVVSILVYLFVLEPVITLVIVKSYEPYALGNAISELTGTAESNGLEDPLGQLPGGLLVAGYALLFAVLGGAIMRSRDVTD